MKRLLSFLLVFCLLLSCSVAALAAGKPVISAQPETLNVKAGGTAVIKIRAKNYTALTWYFVDPDTGEEITARHIGEKFKGLKVKSPNGQTLTLKKVPEEMHGWSVYCHLVGNGYKVNSDTVMILIEGKDASAASPDAPAPESAAPAAATPVPAAPETGEASETVDIVEENVGPVQPFTVTVSGELELYELSRSGKPSGDPQTTLHFEESASFYVKAKGYIQYLLINDIQLTPQEENVSGMTIRGIVKDTVIQGRVIKASPAEENAPAPEPEAPAAEEPAPAAEAPAAEEPAPAAEAPATEEPAPAAEAPAAEEPAPAAEEPAEAPSEEEEEPVLSYTPVEATPAPEIPADTSNMVLVTCERCRFSGGGNSFATSGYVPVGTTITVVCGSGGDLSAGYSVNGAAGTNKGQASFKLTVNEDTTIVMQQRP